MKLMRSKNGSAFLYPKRLYCFRKLSDSLRAQITRPGFLEKCESWRKRDLTENSMGDVFEGRVWKEFLDSDGDPYFSKAGNLGVMLNVDWFQVYKHTNHSCGVIYLVLMNLPREERFKPENVIMVKIIPGPKEPKGDINSFPKPLVDELIDFWDGVIFEDLCLPGGMLKLRVASWHCVVMSQLLENVEVLQAIQQQKVCVIYCQSQRQYFNQLKSLCHGNNYAYFILIETAKFLINGNCTT